MKKPEPVQVIKHRRDAALQQLVSDVPYIQFLGVQFDRRGDELTAVLPFREEHIGNPMLPAIHGGVTPLMAVLTALAITSSSILALSATGLTLPPSISTALSW